MALLGSGIGLERKLQAASSKPQVANRNVEFPQGHQEARLFIAGNMTDDPTGQAFRYDYNLTDHLGNVRVSFSDVNFSGSLFDENTGELEEGEVLQSEHFYPFGMRMGGLSSPISGTENRYRYNGKELHTELNLGLYDYGFRWYDPSMARFVSVDPLAEDFVYLTTYQYSSNSPIFMIDLDGLEGKQIHEIKEEKDGTRRIMRIIYQLDVFVVTGTSGDNYSTFTASDRNEIQKNLAQAFGKGHIDPLTNAKVEFQFNVQVLDFSFIETRIKKGKQMTRKRDRDLSHTDVYRELNKRSEVGDGFVSTYPVFLFERTVPGTDGGRTTHIIELDPEPKEGEVIAVGHEVVHFMLDRYNIIGRDKNSLHHALGGILGRPIGYPNINKAILNKFREFIPRMSNEDIIIKP